MIHPVVSKKSRKPRKPAATALNISEYPLYDLSGPQDGQNRFVSYFNALGDEDKTEYISNSKGPGLSPDPSVANGRTRRSVK